MADGFFVEQFEGITVYTFTNSSEAAIDAWGDALSGLIDSTPDSVPFCVLMDVSSPQVSFSRYARQKTVELFTRYRRRRGRYAFLFSSKTAPHFARIFFASLGKLQFDRQFFSDREKAMDWLKNGLNV
jgi:hypothetical protein